MQNSQPTEADDVFMEFGKKKKKKKTELEYVINANKSVTEFHHDRKGKQNVFNDVPEMNTLTDPSFKCIIDQIGWKIR